MADKKYINLVCLLGVLGTNAWGAAPSREIGIQTEGANAGPTVAELYAQPRSGDLVRNLYEWAEWIRGIIMLDDIHLFTTAEQIQIHTHTQTDLQGRFCVEQASMEVPTRNNSFTPSFSVPTKGINEVKDEGVPADNPVSCLELLNSPEVSATGDNIVYYSHGNGDANIYWKNDIHSANPPMLLKDQALILTGKANNEDEVFKFYCASQLLLLAPHIMTLQRIERRRQNDSISERLSILQNSLQKNLDLITRLPEAQIARTQHSISLSLEDLGCQFVLHARSSITQCHIRLEYSQLGIISFEPENGRICLTNATDKLLRDPELGYYTYLTHTHESGYSTKGTAVLNRFGLEIPNR